MLISKEANIYSNFHISPSTYLTLKCCLTASIYTVHSCPFAQQVQFSLNFFSSQKSCAFVLASYAYWQSVMTDTLFFFPNFVICFIVSHPAFDQSKQEEEFNRSQMVESQGKLTETMRIKERITFRLPWQDSSQRW